MSMPSIVLVMLGGGVVDGAGPYSLFFRHRLFMARKLMLLQVILQTTAALQTFNQPKILTNGGPGFSTNVLMLSIYNNGFSNLGGVPHPGPPTPPRYGVLVRDRALHQFGDGGAVALDDHHRAEGPDRRLRGAAEADPVPVALGELHQG